MNETQHFPKWVLWNDSWSTNEFCDQPCFGNAELNKVKQASLMQDLSEPYMSVHLVILLKGDSICSMFQIYLITGFFPFSGLIYEASYKKLGMCWN